MSSLPNTVLNKCGAGGLVHDDIVHCGYRACRAGHTGVWRRDSVTSVWGCHCGLWDLRRIIVQGRNVGGS